MGTVVVQNHMNDSCFVKMVHKFPLPVDEKNVFWVQSHQGVSFTLTLWLFCDFGDYEAVLCS